jgi:peptidyl-prolyl cis-trans isomerase A (cyclophilin A)
VSAGWEDLNIQDDPVKQSNKRGMVTFAQSSAPNTRSTQLFINYADNANLDGMGFAPIGQVVEGMDVVDSLYGDYGEGAPDGGGPDQMRIVAEGNKYLQASFPKLDFIRKARIVTP